MIKNKSKTRKSISANIEAEIMFLSNLRCCIDNKMGVHIHHIDSNMQNNEMDNLVLLCFECHDRATIKGSLSKKLSAKTILKFRNHHYKKIETERENSLTSITRKITKPNSEDLVSASIVGNLLLEISKIKREYLNNGLMDRNEILDKLLSYTDYNYPRVTFETFQFMQRVAYETRSKLPFNMIDTISRVIEGYFPPNHSHSNKKQIEQTGKQAIDIALTIIYDTSIHSHKYRSMLTGYSLLKYINSKAKELKNNFLQAEIENAFVEMEQHLNRPERNDLDMAKLMLKIYKEEMSKTGYHYPDFKEDLWKQIENEK